jgi:hypothetical protein
MITGHSDIKITSKTYSHFSTVNQKPALEKYNEFLVEKLGDLKNIDACIG